MTDQVCGFNGCERPPGHTGSHASMIGPEEMFDKYGITENQVQDWANEAERGYSVDCPACAVIMMSNEAPDHVCPRCGGPVYRGER